jgi:LuxR family transcriptional regulator, maltose regulon positive regulatory protein
MNLLHSKFQIPKRQSILHRERLVSQLKEINQKRLTIIIAGAGFGKTTLIVDAMEAFNMLPIWFRLDEQDTDFRVFISYLYSAIHEHYRKLHRTAKAEEIPKLSIKNMTDALLDWLAFAQDLLDHETVIVLDDYHLIQDSPMINEAVDFILNRLPDHIHLIIVGRKTLPITLSRFRVMDQLIEINETDLCFSDNEVEVFFANEDKKMTERDINDILYTTGGWVASLVLLRYSMRKQSHKRIWESLDHIKKEPGYIFSYLKENVFDSQPDHVRRFMMKTALLPEINARLCSQFFDVEDAGQILSRMIEDHLFIFPVDDSGNVFYLHHLFRDFLLEQLHENYTGSQVCSLHCRIGERIEPHDVFEAIHHFIEGKDYSQAIRLIKTHEMKFLLEGKINFLGRWIKKIPKPILEKNPQLLLALSRLHSHYGDPEKSITLIYRALSLYKKQDVKEDMIACVIELGSQYYYSGHLKEAKLLMEQVLDDIDPQSQSYVIAMTFLTFFSSVLGDFETSRKYDADAREIIVNYPEFERKIATALIDTSLTHTLYFAGEYEQSQKVCKKLLKTVLKLNIEPCLPLIFYQLSANSYYLEAYDGGIAYARKGIEACEKIGLADSRKGWVYLAWAQNCKGLGDFEAVLENTSKCLELFEGPGNRWGMAHTLELMAATYLEQKKSGLAQKTLDHAFAIIHGYGLTVTRSILENTYAKVLLANNQESAALERLLGAEPNLKEASYHLFNNYLLAAQACFRLGSIKQAGRFLNKVFDLSIIFSFDRFVIKEKYWIIPLLKQGLDKKFTLEAGPHSYFTGLFQKDLKDTSPVLSISFLGKFKLYRGDRKIPLSSWKSSKALMTLKYLAANRQQGYIHKDVLIELLWPEQDPGKTTSRFNMAMSSLRKTLEPDILPKAASLYIDRKNDRYRLFNDDRINVDIEIFSMLYSKAKKINIKESLPHYLEAIRIYKGEFLEEDRYEEWCIDKKNILYSKYIKILRNIISIFEAKKDMDNAIQYSQKLLTANPVDEYIVGKLMVFYADKGLNSRIKETYDTYSTATRHADVPISEKLTKLKFNLVKI